MTQQVSCTLDQRPLQNASLLHNFGLITIFCKFATLPCKRKMSEESCVYFISSSAEIVLLTKQINC